MKNNRDLCRKCFSATDNVVEEALADQEGALLRFIILEAHQHAPRMCETGSGDFRVCHAAESKKTAQATHRVAKRQTATST